MCQWGCGKLGSLMYFWRECKSHFGKQFGNLLELPIDPAIPLLNLPKRILSTCPLIAVSVILPLMFFFFSSIPPNSLEPQRRRFKTSWMYMLIINKIQWKSKTVSLIIELFLIYSLFIYQFYLRIKLQNFPFIGTMFCTQESTQEIYSTACINHDTII